MIRTTRTTLLGVALGGVLALGLSACGSTATPTAQPAGATSSAGTTAGSAAAAVSVASTSLGDVIVDAKGLTLYMFTKDTQGTAKSACTGQCLALWPPLLATGTPIADGVAGTLGTIDTPDGKKQVTLNGWPLYTYAKDTKVGDTSGQKVGKVWFVLDKSGAPVQGEPNTTTGY